MHKTAKAGQSQTKKQRVRKRQNVSSCASPLVAHVAARAGTAGLAGLAVSALRAVWAVLLAEQGAARPLPEEVLIVVSEDLKAHIAKMSVTDWAASLGGLAHSRKNVVAAMLVGVQDRSVTARACLAKLSAKLLPELLGL